MQETTSPPMLAANFHVLCRFAVYIFSLYCAYYMLSIRNPSAPRKKKNTTTAKKISIPKSSTGSPSNESNYCTGGNRGRSGGGSNNESPRSCPTLSPDSKSEEDDDPSQWHPRRSSPTKKVVRLSCVPFEGPSARVGAGLAIHRPSGNLILHGGRSRNSMFGDIHLFNSDKLRWSKLDLLPNHVHKLAMQVTNDGVVVIFGGLDRDGLASDALRTIHLTREVVTWTSHDSSQSPWPDARYGHGMCLCCNDSIAVFGGRDGSGQRLNDLWLLDTMALAENSVNQKLWEKVEPKNNGGGTIRPKPRTVPSIAHLNGKIYLFGQTPRSRGEVEFFNVKHHKWERYVTCGEEPFEQDCQVHALGKAMKLVTISNKESSICSMFNRMDILDTETVPMTWSNVDLSWYGDWTMIPGMRRSFASTMDSNAGILYVFGGVDGASNADSVEYGQEMLDTLVVANFSRHNQSTDEMDG